MKKIIELWFPNYSNNPGYVSKDIRKKLNELTESFDIIVNNGYYQNSEKYIVELEVGTQDYWNYVNSYSIKKNDLKDFDVYVHLVKHKLFRNLKIDYKKNSLILDLNNTLVGIKKKRIKDNKKFKSYFIGTN